MIFKEVFGTRSRAIGGRRHRGALAAFRRGGPRRPVLLLWAAILSAGAGGQVGGAETTVRAVRLDGRTIGGIWGGVREEQLHLHGPDGSESVPLDEILEITWPVTAAAATQPVPSLPRPATATAPAEDDARVQVDLHDGSRLLGRVVAGDARQLVLETQAAGQVSIPLSLLAAVAWPLAEAENVRQVFAQTRAEPEADRDILLVWASERVQVLRGAVESLSPETGSFRWRDRTVPLRPDRVCGLVMARPLQGPPTAPTLCALADGTVLGGRLTAADNDCLHIELSIGGKVIVPVARVVRLRMNSDRVVFLSDLRPAEYHFEPFGLTEWPWRKDRSAANRPMRIGTQAFDRGIGMHSAARLVYLLDGTFGQFACQIGIDAATGGLGNTVFRVLADGREVFHSGPVRGGEEPRPVLVIIEGVRRLELCVDHGEDLDVGDQANWAAARLIRTASMER